MMTMLNIPDMNIQSKLAVPNATKSKIPAFQKDKTVKS